MIRPPADQSLKTYQRVLRQTGSALKAADAVAAAAVVYSRGIFGATLDRKTPTLVTDVARDELPWLVINETCRYRGISVQQVLSGSRKRPMPRVRHEIAWILCEEAGFAGLTVAEELNLADATVVAYGVEMTRARLGREAGLAAEIETLLGRIRDAALADTSARRAA